jgi:hypothetical protein
VIITRDLTPRDAAPGISALVRAQLLTLPSESALWAAGFAGMLCPLLTTAKGRRDGADQG